MNHKGQSPPRWRVTRLIGARAREVCEYEAKDAATAIKRAIREFAVEPEAQKRLAAYRISQ